MGGGRVASRRHPSTPIRRDAMWVLCTGPEASGTRLLTRIVATGADAEHRSMPHGNWWWTADDVDHDRVVAILRDRDVTVRSASKAGHPMTDPFLSAEQRWDRAIESLQTIDPIWVSYEHLVADPDLFVADLGQRLGVALSLPEPIRDENTKWRRDV